MTPRAGGNAASNLIRARRCVRWSSSPSLALVDRRSHSAVGVDAPGAATTGEWPSYAGDNRNHHYSPLDQINAGNFNTLEVAWRFKTDSLGPRPEYKLEGTPLDGRAACSTPPAGTRRSVVALDAATGELLWVQASAKARARAASPRQLSGRGVGYWTDGTGGADLLRHDRLSARRARTRRPAIAIPSFGKNGIVDLKEGVVFGNAPADRSR